MIYWRRGLWKTCGKTVENLLKNCVNFVEKLLRSCGIYMEYCGKVVKNLLISY